MNMELGQFNTNTSVLNKKLNEVISLLNVSELDGNERLDIQERFNNAVQNSGSLKSFQAFETLDNSNTSREQFANDIEFLLAHHQLDSNLSRKFILLENVKLIIQLVSAITLVALGFAMIILPAPPYFEMFTIYYFTPDDGVTLMDVISLLIIFCGVYLMINSFLNMRKSEK